MLNSNYLALAVCLFLVGCGVSPIASNSQLPESRSAERTVVEQTASQTGLVAPPNDLSKPFAISIAPRKQKWKTTDTLIFDVVFYNNSSKAVVVDPFWRRFIECDGKLYMDFSIPKPKFSANLVTHKPLSNVKWTLRINGPFKVMDAKAGKDPLVLAAGEHHLVLIQGEHRSNSVSFTLVE